MRFAFMKSLMLGAAVALAFISSAHAATVVPSVVGASSAYAGYGAVFASDAAPNTDWASNGGGNGSYIDFNLGAVDALTSVTLTDRVTSGGANGGFVGGTSDFTTSFSLQTFSDASFSSSTGVQSFVKAAPVSPTTAAAFTVTDPLALTGQYVRYTVLTANGANPGLSNITFGAVSAAPEPGAWVLMLSGLGLVGGAIRLRKGRHSDAARLVVA